MQYNGVIDNKLRLLDRKIDEIRSWNITDYTSFKESSLLQNAVERALQVATEIVIDIAEQILAIQGLSPQETSARAIEKLQDLGILTDAKPFMEMVRFRNFIVHRYEYIDSEILFDIVQSKLHLFSEFSAAVRKK
jgi:uncharacterized protein YutE (UPF0331/DUF86 family)